MIWLTWRQYRAQTAVAVMTLTAFAVILGVTGPNLAHAYAASGLASCRANCSSLASTFLSQMKSNAVYPLLYFAGGAALYPVPALIGVFWGAPLVTGSRDRHLRLAWNQSVTRTRWMAAKLGLIGLAAMATAGLLSLMVTWWSGPIDQAAVPGDMGQLSRFSPLMFDARGLTPIGYAAFAFPLGVTVGVLIRRTVPAMAVTLAARCRPGGLASVVRPHLIPPATATSAVSVDVNTARVGHNGGLAVPWLPICPGRGSSPTRPSPRRGRSSCYPMSRPATPAPSSSATGSSPASTCGGGSPTSPPGASGPSRPMRQRSSQSSRSPWPGSAFWWIRARRVTP